ncbi:sugar kinase [Aestuariispira ectoiniformans]|uniref:sugar kinase n=1 Tax=Aestuariispira ectoiniformans TaxID=2775080 RepID=UPI00223B2D69|nr:sugar kinase [Aestuariispira ectoiniformans]
MTSVGIIGECMVELFDTGDGLYRRTYGGDTLNTAVYLARCGGSDIDVHYATILGDDSLSQEMVDGWQAEGIRTDLVERLAGTVPGLYLIQTDETGERSFLYWRNEAPAKKLFQTDNAEALETALMKRDWLYFSGISLAILPPAGRAKLFALLDRFRARGGKVAYDGNYRPRLWPEEEARDAMVEAYRRCDLALPSYDDECALWQDEDEQAVLGRLWSYGCTEIVLKCGTDPCWVISAGAQRSFDVSAVTGVVDTTAAGDSFNAGYLASRTTGGDVPQAVAAGQAVAAQVIQQKGAIVPILIPEIVKAS